MTTASWACRHQPIEVTLLDDRRLVVDAFARWRIVDLVRFRAGGGRRRRCARRSAGWTAS